jgi:rRNA maturation endonuclease Nob1
MAHLRDIRQRCLRCNRPATVELLNNYNAPAGHFCRACGKRALAAMERRIDERAARWREEKP